MNRLGVFLPNWVGDAAMATPTLRALRKRLGPHGLLVGIMRPPIAEVLAGTAWIDQELVYDPRSRDRQLSSWTLVRRLRSLKLDTALLLTNSLRTGILAWLSGAARRVGYARNLRGWMLTHAHHAPRQHGRFVPTPVLDYYLDMAYGLGCLPESPNLELATLEADEEAADRAFARLRLPSDRAAVIINNSGAYGAAKLWPASYFAMLARRIATVQNLPVLVLCGPSERETAREIVRAADHPRVVSLADEPLSIGLSKACVRRSQLMITTDSGPRHFAAAFDVPVITLFGPTHIAWSENHYPRAVHLQREMDCGPCQQRVCPLGHHRCMRDLTVDQVYRVVQQQLDQPRRAVA